MLRLWGTTTSGAGSPRCRHGNPQASWRVPSSRRQPCSRETRPGRRGEAEALRALLEGAAAGPRPGREMAESDRAEAAVAAPLRGAEEAAAAASQPPLQQQQQQQQSLPPPPPPQQPQQPPRAEEAAATATESGGGSANGVKMCVAGGGGPARAAAGGTRGGREGWRQAAGPLLPTPWPGSSPAAGPRRSGAPT